ncbi:hypothetical protein [Nocardia miyunensis]|uniref:hypothetical protein n=1 Tax=Nocardia miyunensis TaxID=282684 RepID=UPI0012F4A57C|nr:hypothetical protein [Nocardia miyunensis]
MEHEFRGVAAEFVVAVKTVPEAAREAEAAHQADAGRAGACAVWPRSVAARGVRR